MYEVQGHSLDYVVYYPCGGHSLNYVVQGNSFNYTVFQSISE